MRADLAQSGDRAIARALRSFLTRLRARFTGIAPLEARITELLGSVDSFVQAVQESGARNRASEALERTRRLVRRGRLATAYLACRELLKEALTTSLRREVEQLKDEVARKLRSRGSLPPVPSGKEK